MTLRELVFMVLDECKIHSDDSYFNEDHVSFLLSKYRSFLLKKELEKENKNLSSANAQTICLNLMEVPAIEDFDCSGSYLRSTEKIPSIVNEFKVQLYPLDYYQGEIIFTSRERMRYTGYNKWTKNLIYASKGPDDYLYLKSENPQYLYMKKLRMTAIFENFEVKNLYTREYKQTFIDNYGNKQELFSLNEEYYWDNKEVFEDMITLAENKDIPITYIDEESNEEELNLNLEDFKIQIVNNNLYNTEKQKEYKIIPSENNNSLGVIVSKGEKRAFLAGDIGNEDGDEDYLISDSVTKDLLKDIDVLKIGHHGMNGSYSFISYLNPKITIVTGGEYFSPGGQGYESLKSINAKNVYTTNENSNIILSFSSCLMIVTILSMRCVLCANNHHQIYHLLIRHK